MQKRIKRVVSSFLVFLLVLNVLPLESLKVYASTPNVTSISITKEYLKGNIDAPDNYTIDIIGTDLETLTLQIGPEMMRPITGTIVKGANLVRYVIPREKMESILLVSGKVYTINESIMPNIETITRFVKKDEKITITGSNFTASEVSIYYGAKTSKIEIKDGVNDATVQDEQIKTKVTGDLESKNIIFEKILTIAETGNPTNVTWIAKYSDVFKVYGEIDVDGTSIDPNKGRKGQEVTITAQQFAAPYSVFFMKEGENRFTFDNIGKSQKYYKEGDVIKRITVQVPQLSPGTYNVYLTNQIVDAQITPGKDFTDSIVRQKEIGQFIVVDDAKAPFISYVEKSTGPDTGQEVQVIGKNFEELNIDDLKISTGVFEPGVGTSNTSTTPENKLRIVYPIKTVSDEIAKYQGKEVTSIEKEIQVIIGSVSQFTDINKNDFKNGSGSFDTLFVNAKLNSPDALADPAKDVVMEIKTTIKYTDENGAEVIKIFNEKAIWDKKYIFTPSFVAPTIDSISPNKIQVEQDGSAYTTKHEMILRISGKKFMVYKYTTQDGREVVNYPAISLGGDHNTAPIVLQRKNNDVFQIIKNSDGTVTHTKINASLEVLNQAGRVVDGTKENQEGVKIVVRIPKGMLIPENRVGPTLPVGLGNPINNSESLEHGPFMTKLDLIQFVSGTDNPSIMKVTPNVVTVNGGEAIVIDGTNFKEGVQVTIDGEVVRNIRRESSFRITLTAPPGREGETKIQVMNPTGEMDVKSFIYVQSSEKAPKIIDFNPKSGTENTLVRIAGENFLRPDISVVNLDGIGMDRLLGTKVLLEGKDINQYNTDPSTGKNILKQYTDSQKIFQRNDQGMLRLADYYRSIILQEVVGTTPRNQFYKVEVDGRGNILLIGNSGDKITTYNIEIKDNKIVAIDNNKSYEVEETSGIVTLKHEDGTEKNFNVMTPYYIDPASGKITGNRIRVLESGEIQFSVPNLVSRDWYDVTVRNPDTKQDTKANEQGFYYLSGPESKPSITNITPNQGSVIGGYFIEIQGTDFEDNSNPQQKTKVFIGGVQVPVAEVNILSNTRMRVRVPAYTKNLTEETGSNSKAVPVVIVNFDGGTASAEKGFTYFKSNSSPRIDKINPTQGKAAGDEVVSIWGYDFRFSEPYTDSRENATLETSTGKFFMDLNGNGVRDVLVDEQGRKIKDYEAIEDYEKILPKVYFGDAQAEVIDFAKGYLEVRTPKGAKGKVDVYVINNDYGISNKVAFTYDSSAPVIQKITPNVGKKQGNDKVELIGSGFEATKIWSYKRDTDNPADFLPEEIEIPLVRFGDMKDRNMSNLSIPLNQPNDGRVIAGNKTKVILDNTTVIYDPIDKTLNIEAVIQNQKYTGEFSYDKEARGNTVYIPMHLLTENKQYELIKVSFDPNEKRIFIERGYAPIADRLSATQVLLQTPSYYTVGKVPVSFFNFDGGEGKGQFEYKNPDSKPSIINILKEGREPIDVKLEGKDAKIIDVSYKGGNTIAVIGSDFRENAIIQVGDIITLDSKGITYTLPSRMTFVMPKVDERHVGRIFRVVVLNEDGGNTSSDLLTPPIYIRIIKGDTAPEATELNPKQGPSSGGTKVTIKGKDFRQGLSVFFGETKATNVTVIDYKTIEVITPPHTPGKVDVKIENPDGELTVLKQGFTYLSTPTITAVVDPSDPTETQRITEISVEGGQEIKLKGTGYIQGARVVFSPVIRKAVNNETAGTIIYIQGVAYVLESGIDAQSVEFVNTETLRIKTPAAKLDSFGIIIINPDGGASNPYEGIKYGLPTIQAPTGVVARIDTYDGVDRSIKISWDQVDKATQYDIYVVINNRQQELIGSTKLTTFVYEALDTRTTYRFIVKAIGDVSTSKASRESNPVTTGRIVGPPDTDGGLSEKTTMTKTGDKAEVVIGDKDYDVKETVIDLTKGTLAGSKEVVVSISAKAITAGKAKDIRIVGKDFVIKINPSAFNVAKVQENRNKAGAGVRFSISPHNGSIELQAGKSAVASHYMIQAQAFVGTDRTNIDTLASSMELLLDVDSAKASLRRLNTFALSRYDESSSNWSTVLSSNDANAASLRALYNRLGRYTIIGGRR